MEAEEFMEFDTAEEQIFGHEYSVRERCQQFGISLDNVRFRVGIDRFKWLAMSAMLSLKKDHDLFDDLSIDIFFERVIPKIPDAQHKNALACVLVYYTCVDPQLHFSFDKNKLEFIEKNVFPSQEFLFQNHGLKLHDLVRYIRLFQSFLPR